MNDLDERITRVLYRHAEGTEIENNLDVIISDGHIVRFTTATERRSRRTSQLVVAAAACLLIIGGGIALGQLQSDTASDPAAAGPPGGPQAAPIPATDLGGPVFPVLGNVPEISAEIYPTSVAFFAPYVTSMTLGRADGDRLIDVITISTAAAGDTDAGEVLVPSDAQVSSATIGGRGVVVYDNAGGRWYRWIDDGVVVLVEASTDSEMIVAQINTTLDVNTGLVKLELGAIPAGLNITAAPAPLTGSQPGLSTDADPGEPNLDLYPTDTPLLIQTGVVDTYTMVDINGAVGYAVDSDDGAIVSWKTDSGIWLRLSASFVDAQRITEIARDVQLVDQASWNARYDTSFDNETPTPPTTMP